MTQSELRSIIRKEVREAAKAVIREVFEDLGMLTGESKVQQQQLQNVQQLQEQMASMRRQLEDYERGLSKITHNTVNIATPRTNAPVPKTRPVADRKAIRERVLAIQEAAGARPAMSEIDRQMIQQQIIAGTRSKDDLPEGMYDELNDYTRPVPQGQQQVQKAVLAEHFGGNSKMAEMVATAQLDGVNYGADDDDDVDMSDLIDPSIRTSQPGITKQEMIQQKAKMNEMINSAPLDPSTARERIVMTQDEVDAMETVADPNDIARRLAQQTQVEVVEGIPLSGFRSGDIQANPELGVQVFEG